MVALLTDPISIPCRPRPEQRPLRLVHSGPTASPMSIPAVLVVVALVLATVVTGLRLVQGAPPASSWTELAGTSATSASPLVQPGDVVIRVEPGETLWSIATRLEPDQDPRPVVDALARANGGTVLRAGQELVIPAALVRP